MQVRHRADVVRTLHRAIAAGLDGRGAVAEVVVEGVVLPVQEHEMGKRREVRRQRVGRDGRLPHLPRLLRARSGLAHRHRLDRLAVGDVEVLRLRELRELHSRRGERGAETAIRTTGAASVSSF